MKKVKNNLLYSQYPHVAGILIDLLQQGETVRFTVKGPSMYPGIRSGASVTVAPWNPDIRIPRGSIVFFRQHNRLALHRLILHDPHANTFHTTGDAALRGTETVPASDLIGIARSVTHGTSTRHLDSLLARHLGLILFYTRPLRRLIDKNWFQRRKTYNFEI